MLLQSVEDDIGTQAFQHITHSELLDPSRSVDAPYI